MYQENELFPIQKHSTGRASQTASLGALAKTRISLFTVSMMF
jgi:hypothetical protein